MRESTTYYPNPHEQAFAEWARSQGWTVTKQGWPDFICRRGEEVMAVEVKGGNDGLRGEQAATMRDLRAAGLPTFMWTPESGLTTPIATSLPTSIPVLQDEIARLRQTLGEVTGLRRRVLLPAEPKRAPEWVDDEMGMIAEVAAMCSARHRDHATLSPRDRMTLCAWIMAMRKTLTVADMARIANVDDEYIQRQLDYAVRHAKAWQHRERHVAIKGTGLRCKQCERGEPAAA